MGGNTSPCRGPGVEGCNKCVIPTYLTDEPGKIVPLCQPCRDSIRPGISEQDHLGGAVSVQNIPRGDERASNALGLTPASSARPSDTVTSDSPVSALTRPRSVYDFNTSLAGRSPASSAQLSGSNQGGSNDPLSPQPSTPPLAKGDFTYSKYGGDTVKNKTKEQVCEAYKKGEVDCVWTSGWTNWKLTKFYGGKELPESFWDKPTDPPSIPTLWVSGDGSQREAKTFEIQKLINDKQISHVYGTERWIEVTEPEIATDPAITAKVHLTPPQRRRLLHRNPLIDRFIRESLRCQTS